MSQPAPNDFDARASTWDSGPQKVDRAQKVAQAIQKSLPLRPEMTALEYGCGTGLLSFALRERFAQLTLADTSAGMLQTLAEKIRLANLQNMTWQRLDLLTDPLPPARFDVLYSLMTLHHIPDTAFLLRQFVRLLRPGGWLALADLDEEDGSFHPAGTPGIHPGFARPALQRKVQAAGFGQLRFETVYKISKNQRLYPVFLLTAQKT